jgi:hypothetical protein
MCGSRIQLPLYSATYCCGSGKVLDLQREETVEPWCLVIGAWDAPNMQLHWNCEESWVLDLRDGSIC